MGEGTPEKIFRVPGQCHSIFHHAKLNENHLVEPAVYWWDTRELKHASYVFEPRTKTGSEHFACHDSGLS